MWNLNDLYEGFNEKYQQDIQTLKSHMEAFKSFIETKDNQDVQTFLETYFKGRTDNETCSYPICFCQFKIFK